MKNIEKIQEYKELIQKETGDKYDRPGIYCIKFNDKIVYVGKSRNCLERLASHICNIRKEQDEWKSHKYEVMRDALIFSCSVGFDLLEGDLDDDQLLGEREGYWIRYYLPPLNYQIPKEEDYHKYTVNRNAMKITFKEIMGIK